MPTTEKLVYPEGSFPPKSASWWASGPSLVKVKNTKYKIQISKYKYKMVGVWALSGQGEKYKIQISKYKYKIVGVWALSGQGEISPTFN